MRIFLFTGSDYGAGTFVRAREFARALLRKGHFVVLGYLGDKSFQVEKKETEGFLEIGFPRFLNRLNLDHFSSPLAKFQVKKFLEEMRFDVVHGFEHYSVIHYAAMYSRDRFGSIYVSDWADWISVATKRRFYKLPGGRSYLEWLEKRAKVKADGITVISRVLYQEAMALKKSRDNLLYLPGGSPIHRLQPRDIGKCRDRLDFSRECVVFGYLGSFLTEELIPFIEAFSLISIENESKMVIIGRSSVELVNYVREKSLQERVIITGFLPESQLNDYLCACNALLIPMFDNLYNRSRWPNKIGDYIACGRPVIASSVGEVISVFTKGDIGFMVSNYTDDILNAMEIIVKNEEGVQYVLGSNARKVAEEISWDSLSNDLLNFYIQIKNSIS